MMTIAVQKKMDGTGRRNGVFGAGQLLLCHLALVDRLRFYCFVSLYQGQY